MADKADLLQRLRGEGFSEDIVNAFDQVKREQFMPDDYKRYSYEDAALPIGYNQTISQPSTIAFMLTLLEPDKEKKVLEIGCGSGYVLALLSHIFPDSKIYGTERIKDLAEQAQKRLKKYKNVKVVYTPGKVGLPAQKPFDRILVSAAAHDIPYYIIEQLAEEGIAVCPVRRSIMKFTRNNNKIEKEGHFGFSFVPLIE